MFNGKDISKILLQYINSNYESIEKSVCINRFLNDEV